MSSRGSVVPVFLKQREDGKITVTDERMTRFLITLEQGAQFVIRCLDQMRGGEIYVPKIPSIRITDLASTIAPGCEVEIIGMRPGEKMHEVLISRDESRSTVEFSDMFVIQPQFPWWGEHDWSDGRTLPDGFEYSSDMNDHWLSTEDLQKVIRDK